MSAVSRELMFYFCEPYFHALNRWMQYDDDELLKNRVQLIAALVDVINARSNPRNIINFETEDPGVPLLAAVVPSAGELFLPGYDLQAFRAAATLVSPAVFQTGGLYFQKHLLRALSFGYTLSNETFRESSAYRAIMTVFRLPESCGHVFLYTTAMPDTGDMNKQRLPLLELSPDTKTLFDSLILNKTRSRSSLSVEASQSPKPSQSVVSESVQSAVTSSRSSNALTPEAGAATVTDTDTADKNRTDTSRKERTTLSPVRTHSTASGPISQRKPEHSYPSAIAAECSLELCASSSASGNMKEDSGNIPVTEDREQEGKVEEAKDGGIEVVISEKEAITAPENKVDSIVEGKMDEKEEEKKVVKKTEEDAVKEGGKESVSFKSHYAIDGGKKSEIENGEKEIAGETEDKNVECSPDQSSRNHENIVIMSPHECSLKSEVDNKTQSHSTELSAENNVPGDECSASSSRTPSNPSENKGNPVQINSKNENTEKNGDDNDGNQKRKRNAFSEIFSPALKRSSKRIVADNNANPSSSSMPSTLVMKFSGEEGESEKNKEANGEENSEKNENIKNNNESTSEKNGEKMGGKRGSDEVVEDSGRQSKRVKSAVDQIELRIEGSKEENKSNKKAVLKVDEKTLITVPGRKSVRSCVLSYEQNTKTPPGKESDKKVVEKSKEKEKKSENESDDIIWTKEHSSIGTKVAGLFDEISKKSRNKYSTVFSGQVTLFAAESDKGAKDELYHILWEDGDEEDYDASDLAAGVRRYKTSFKS